MPNAQFLVGLLTGGVITWFAHWLVMRREAKTRIRKAKDEFITVISSQFAKLEIMKLKEAEFYRQSLPTLTEAVHKVRPFVKDDEWLKLHLTLTKYKEQGQESFEGGKARIARAAAYDLVLADFGEARTHEQALHSFLQCFEDAIQT